jgi:hypothetical protein
MRITGEGILGPPTDRTNCMEQVLRRAVELGVSLDHVSRATSVRDDLLFAR